MMKQRSLIALVLSGLALVAAAALVPFEHVSGKRHGRATQGMDCGTCHTPEGWQVRQELREGDRFDHDLTGFPLRAGHVRAACTECHDGRAELQRACSACHEDSHAGRLGQQCDSCHSAISFQATDAIALHSKTRLPLTGMHALVDCSDCHRRRTSRGFSTVPSQCFACHEQDYRSPDVHPVHDGSTGEAPFPRNCAECHRTDAFSPAVVDPDRFLSSSSAALQMDPRDHDLRFVISRGPHRDATCRSCHVAEREPRMVRCTGCHAHGLAQLRAQHQGIGTPGDGSCTACHRGGFGR